MNRWIEDRTHGRIKNHISDVNPQTSMFVFNALYFNGKWQDPFDKSKGGGYIPRWNGKRNNGGKHYHPCQSQGKGYPNI